MVNELDVFDALSRITTVRDSDYPNALDICGQCFDSIKKELKNSTDTSDPRIITTAAAKAFYMLCLKEKAAEQGGVTAFKAGDISISQSGGEIDGKLKAAEKLYEDERRKLLPLLEDRGFFAGKVDIL